MAITGAFHLAWMFTAELFPTKYRSLAVGLAGVKARVGSICSPYINDILGEIVVWAPSALFGIVSLIAAGLSLLLPDTKGRDLPESNEFDSKENDKRNGTTSYHLSAVDREKETSPSSS
ncbi:hypothetical protein SK128_010364 [Halocaridina rubra]|uniref:Major facilitator superfamily (MFS) profile domain-containing protein n=1 Tax=Halocaridina rubra TaxID=373956 RepID=A0AAN8X1A6_HALRR